MPSSTVNTPLLSIDQQPAYTTDLERQQPLREGASSSRLGPEPSRSTRAGPTRLAEGATADGGAKAAQDALRNDDIIRAHSEPAQIIKCTTYSQASRRLIDHRYFEKNSWKPHKENLKRTFILALSRASGITIRAAGGLFSGMLGYWATDALPKTWLFRWFTGGDLDKSALLETVLSGTTLLLDPNFKENVKTMGIRPEIALALLVGAVYLQAEREAGTGRELALATALNTAISKALSDLGTLLTTLKPTGADDIWKTYQAVISVNNRREAIKSMNMPDGVRDAVELLQAEIVKQFRTKDMKAARRAGDEVPITSIKNLVQTLDMQFEMWERSVEPIRNVWHYDQKTPEAAEAREEYKKLEKKALEQVSDPKSKEALKDLMSVSRLLTAGKLTEAKKLLKGKAYAAAVLYGEPGTGKSYLTLLLSNLYGRPIVDCAFEMLLEYMEPDNAKDMGKTDNDTPWSPFDKYFHYLPFMLAPRDALFVANEADFLGRKAGARRDEPDEQLASRINRAWETSGSGVVSKPAYPLGSSFNRDHTEAVFLFTTNRRPMDPAHDQRFFMIEVNGPALSERRRRMAETAKECMEILPEVFATLTATQQKAIEADVASVMEFIYQEGLKDKGIRNTEGVIRHLFRELGRAYADKERSAPPNLPKGDPMEVEDDALHGPHWEEKDVAQLDPWLKDRIKFAFGKHRGVDRVSDALDDMERFIRDNNLKGKSLPTADDYYEKACKLKMKPGSVARFMLRGLEQQWKDVLARKPEDFQRSARSLFKSAESYAAGLRDHDSSDRSGAEFGTNIFSAMKIHCQTYDALLRMATEPKNLSHWEAGADEDARKFVTNAMATIVDRLCGEKRDGDEIQKEQRSSLAAFLSKYIDSTIRLPAPTISTFRGKKLPPSTLIFSGPEGSGKRYQALRVAEDLNMRSKVLSLDEYLSLFEKQKTRRIVGFDEWSSIIPAEILGDIDEDLLDGNEDNEIDKVLIIDMSDYESLSDEQKAKVDRCLASNGTGPTIKSAIKQSVTFDYPVRAMLKIVITTTPLDALGSLGGGFKIAMSKATPEEFRKVAEDAFKAEVQLLDAIALPTQRKRTVFDEAANMMEYILATAQKQELTPAIVKTAIGSLFDSLTGREKQAIRIKGKETARSVQGASEARLPLIWPIHDIDHEMLSKELINFVDKSFAEEKKKLAQKNTHEVAGTENDSSEEDADIVRKIEEQLERIGPEDLTKLIASAIEKFPFVAPTESGQMKALCDAITNGDETQIRDVLQHKVEKGTFILKETNGYGDPPLHVAIGLGNRSMDKTKKLAIVNLLLEHPLFPQAASATDRLQRGPLHVAVEQGELEILKVLIERKEKDGRPLFKRNAVDVAGNSPLGIAASSKSREIFDALLDDKDVDVNHKNHNGDTVLHCAVRARNTQFIQALIEKRGEDVVKSSTNSEGKTAAVLATEMGELEIVNILLKTE